MKINALDILRKNVEENLLSKLPQKDVTNGYGALFKSQRKFYALTALLIVLGFAFFLTSSSWFPSNENFRISTIGEKLVLNTQVSVTLKRWEYNTKNQFFEVEIGKISTYIDDNYSFLINFYADGKKHIPLKIVYNGDGIMVLQSDQIPKADYVRLDVTLKYTEDGKPKQSTGLFYSEPRTAAVNDELEADRTEEEYILGSYENDLKLKINQLKQNAETITRLGKENEEYDLKISELEALMETQTNDEKTTSRTKLTNYQSKLKNNETEMERLKEDNESIQKDLERLQDKLQGQ